LIASKRLVANTVEVGGIHCKKGEALPKHLQEFMDNAKSGVVYVSFGSTVKPSEMSAEKRQIFIDVFKQLKHPVLWK
jgi:glucuronosyltransferase